MSMARRTICILCVGVVTCVSLDAFADTWATGSYLMWPAGGAADAMPVGVPLDTQVWIESVAFAGQPSYTLRRHDGELVDTRVEVITRRQGDGPLQRMAVLTPLELLEPNTIYTVASVDDLESGSHEYHFPLEEVPFETGGAATRVTPIKATDLEYVAHGGLDLEYGGCCDSDPGDTLHSVRWKTLTPDSHWLAKLDITYPGEAPLTTFGVANYSEVIGDFERIATHSLGQDVFPCVDFTLIDTAGREIASLSACEPSMCTSDPPFRGANSPEFSMFLSDPLQWDAYATPCTPEQAEGADDGAEGCATAPASPIPHAPLALGGLALLGLSRVRRTKRRHV